MSRMYPVVLLLGLVLMVAGAATTYVALGQDGETEAAEAEATQEILPTPPLEPTIEPPVVEAPPVQPVVEQPVQNPEPVQPTAVPPEPTQVIVPTEVIPPTEIILPTLEVVVEQTETVAPVEIMPPTVENMLPTEALVVVEQTEAVAPAEIIPPTVEAATPEQTEAVAPTLESVVPVAEVAAPEQTEVLAPTEAVIVPEQTEAVMPTEAVVPEQTEAVVPTEVIDSNLIPTMPGKMDGQSNGGEVPTVGPENPLEITPSVMPTSEAPDMAATAEATLEPTADLLPSATPGDLIATEVPAEATEEVVNTGTLIRGSASSAFGQVQGITLTLTQPDGTVLEAVTDEQGGFTFEGLLPGDYTLNAVTPGALSSQAVFTLTAGQQFDLPPTVLAIGDLNQDNQIDMNDVVLLAANYNYPAEAIGIDLNGDAWIDISDLAIIGAQFGAVGPLPWS